MEVRSNRIGDIRSHYRLKLASLFTEKEADTLLFQVLMEYTGYSKAGILTNHNDAVSESQLLKIHFAVKELLKEKPIQYVLGKTEFYGLPFIVNSKVLIPRPETEDLVEMVIRELNNIPAPKIMDLGTGSGCIAISLKKNLPKADVTAIDVSDFALEVASVNADLNDAQIRFKKFNMLEGNDWTHDLVFDAVVSNPPYVRKKEKAGMQRNVLEYEPELALFVEDADPLIFYRAIIEFAGKFLSVGGLVVVEINQYLWKEVEALFAAHRFDDVSIHKDFRGNARMLSCRNL